MTTLQFALQTVSRVTNLGNKGRKGRPNNIHDLKNLQEPSKHRGPLRVGDIIVS